MADTRGILCISVLLCFKNMDGHATEKRVVLHREVNCTAQQAKGIAADWRGMNPDQAGTIIAWTAHTLHL